MDESLKKVLEKLEFDFSNNIVRYRYDLTDPDTFETYYVVSINEADYRMPISKQEIESAIYDNTFENVYKIIKEWMASI